ncbi:hypothetical protein [Methylotuvimicrobium buryatense]|uniref:Uncharacterized protein n=1 Tax=Methylotuvimicrobium buryatense TaxID=95641 RepID=A0A4V1IJJ0_METBY|nr:hypothetical protein [Methylotuvimicrobium buryatense]QCW81575.1 hypothetical protein EQU24_04420 [Methylotuvimicrobium buryatense]
MALEIYLARVQNNDSVRTVATMGSIGAPGLSDLDLIVITEDSNLGGKQSNLSVKGINDGVFLHGPVILPISMKNEIQFIIYASNIDIIFGNDRPPSFDELTKEEKIGLSVCYLLDFTQSRMLQYWTAEKNGELDVRAWATRTWSVFHSINLLKNLDIELKENCIELLDIVKLPRDLWCNGEVFSPKHIVDAFEASKAINDVIFLSVLKKFYELPSDPPKSIRGYRSDYYFEHEDVKPITISRHIKLGGRRFDISAMKMPARYYSHLCTYRSAIRNSSDIDRIDRSFIGVASNRARIIKAHQEWVLKHVPHSDSMTGYLALSKPKNLTPRSIVRDLFQSIMKIGL